MAPLHDVERGAGSVNPGNNDDIYIVLTSTTVSVVDYSHGRDVGEPPGWTGCWLGLGVGDEIPKPTWRMSKHLGTTSTDRGTSWLAGQTSNLAKCAVSSTGLWWQRGDAGFAVLGIPGLSGGDTITGWHGQQHQGRDHQ